MYAVEGAGGPEYCDEFVERIRRRVGRPRLVQMPPFGYAGWRERQNALANELYRFFMENEVVEEWIAGLEIICQNIELYAMNKGAPFAEMNELFGQHNFGWRYKHGGIFMSPDSKTMESMTLGIFVRTESESMHTAVIEPAFDLLLQNPKFVHAHAELQVAFKHFRSGCQRRCDSGGLQISESTMKVVCTIKKWSFKPTDPASKLISAIVENGLVAPFWQTNLNALSGMLNSTVPTARNKLHAHGWRRRSVGRYGNGEVCTELCGGGDRVHCQHGRQTITADFPTTGGSQ